MAVFRVERTAGYTVMSNHHLRNKNLSLKAKGLLSQMLSLPEDWDFTLAGLSYINREKIDAELIFRFVYNMADCKKPMRRLWISSMEADAIRAGFADLKHGAEYDALYASALCRAKADWIIGINATRLFFLPVSQDVECRAGADADLKNAC